MQLCIIVSHLFRFSLPSSIPNLQSYFLEMCKLFPDGNIAKMVPLPSSSSVTVDGNDSL